MSRGTECMKSEDRDMWRFGYLFVDSSNQTGRSDIDVNRCELNFLLGDAADVTLFFHVSGINRNPGKYDFILFEDEAGKKLILVAEIHFQDGFSKSLNTEFIYVGNSRIGEIAADMMRIFHPLIWSFLIVGRPPMKDGQSAIVWYVGFTRKIVTDMEYSSQMMLRPIVLSLAQFLPH